MTYEELLIKSEHDNLIVKEKDIPGYGGRIYKNRIAIHKGLKPKQKKLVCLQRNADTTLQHPVIL